MFTYTLNQIKDGTGFANDAAFLPVTEELRADFGVLDNLNTDKIKLDAALEDMEAGTRDYDDAIAELEVVHAAMLDAAIDLLESLAGERG